MMEFKIPRHRSLNLRLDAFPARQDRLNAPLLLLRWEVNNGPELSFGHDGRGQGIAEGDDGLRDLRGKPQKPKDLVHTGTGDP